MIPIHAYFQIIAGEGGGRILLRLLVRVSMAEGEDAERAAKLGLAKGGGLFFAEGAEFAGAAFDDGAGDFVRKRGGLGAGTLRKREDVEIGEGERFNEGYGCGMVLAGFAGEAGDDIGTDGSVGEAFMD